MSNLQIEELLRFYSGFYICEAMGNNAFSYDRRELKEIYVPAAVQGSLADLAVGQKIVFAEMEKGEERNCVGLQNFVYFQLADRPVFIFDNHNHAFFFWLWAYKQGLLQGRRRLLHVDQHSDRAEPNTYFDLDENGGVDLEAAFNFTNYMLNVGNFIRPALRLGLFADVIDIDGLVGFESFQPVAPVALDIDLDIFSDDMKYVNYKLKVEKVKQYLRYADVISIATSPFFMDQARAIELIHEILG